MKRVIVIFAVLSVLAVLLAGCSDPIRVTETPVPVVAIVNDKGIFCSDNINVTYMTHNVLDSYDCDQNGLIVSSKEDQQLRGSVAVSNFKPAIGEKVIVTYTWKKFDHGTESSIDACEISTGYQLHEQGNTGQFVINADKKATYTVSCPNGDTSIEAEFTLRTVNN